MLRGSCASVSGAERYIARHPASVMINAAAFTREALVRRQPVDRSVARELRLDAVPKTSSQEAEDSADFRGPLRDNRCSGNRCLRHGRHRCAPGTAIIGHYLSVGRSIEQLADDEGQYLAAFHMKGMDTHARKPSRIPGRPAKRPRPPSAQSTAWPQVAGHRSAANPDRCELTP